MMSQSLNSTTFMFPDDKTNVGHHLSTTDVMEGVTLAAILFFSLVGNALVCYCGITSPRGQAMNRFIVNSAFAEILLAILVLPLYIQRQFSDSLKNINPNLCRLLQYFQTVALGVINISFMLIALDRYFSIFLSPTKITLRQAQYMIVVSWCFPLLVTSPIFLDLSGDTTQPQSLMLHCSEHEDTIMNKFNKIYSLVQIAAVSILPMCLLSATYFVMITRVLRIDVIRRNRKTPDRRKSPCGTSREEIPVAKRRSLVMNFIVSSLFLFCWSPIVTLYTVHVIQGRTSHSEKSLYGLLSYIALANLSFNPLVYCFFDSVFRNHVLCCLRNKRTPRRGGNFPKTKEPLTEDKLTELTVSKIGSATANNACADQEPLLAKGAAQPKSRRSFFSRDKLAKLVCNTRRYRSLGLSRGSEI